MTTTGAPDTLIHPEHGELPARRLVDCVFALTPAGRILHFHVEQMAVTRSGDTTRYALTTAPARPERARCQVIPPFVSAFGKHA